MGIFLEPGMILETVKKQQLTIEAYLRETPGAYFYRVQMNGSPKILRWIRSSPMDTEIAPLWERMQRMVCNQDLLDICRWPEDLLDGDEEGFGVVENPLPEEMYAFSDLLSGKIRLHSFRQRIDLAVSLVHAYHRLHEAGWCYGAHHGDFSINPKTGAVYLTDMLSLLPCDSTLQPMGAVRYRAPEALLEPRYSHLDNERYVMAVYLFQLLCTAHPLEGRRYLQPVLTPAVEKALYASEPLFLFSRNSMDNAPIPGIQDAAQKLWQFLPDYLKELFYQVFDGPGLHDPAARPSDEQWMDALLKFRQEMLSCPCGGDWLDTGGARQVCPVCGSVLQTPVRMVVSGETCPVFKGARIYPGHLAEEMRWWREPVAQVMEKSNTPGVLGLQNRSGWIWTVEDEQGQYPVEPRKVAVLKPGMTIRMENWTVQIEKTE